MPTSSRASPSLTPTAGSAGWMRAPPSTPLRSGQRWWCRCASWRRRCGLWTQGGCAGACCGRDAGGARHRPGGDGGGFLSLVHVVDFAAAVADALERASGGSVFNVVDEPVRQGEYLERLAHRVGAAPPPRGPSEEAGLPSQRISNSHVREALGWRPTRGVWPEPEPG
jgi:hypothetical protein